MKFSSSLPYFNALLKAPNNRRISILRAFPSFVVDDIVEVLYNVVLGRADIGSRKKKVAKYQNALMNLINIKSRNGRGRVIYNQNGGFLRTLLPIIIGLASNML